MEMPSIMACMGRLADLRKSMAPITGRCRGLIAAAAGFIA
jgi:hypothetical protein